MRECPEDELGTNEAEQRSQTHFSGAACGFEWLVWSKAGNATGILRLFPGLTRPWHMERAEGRGGKVDVGRWMEQITLFCAAAGAPCSARSFAIAKYLARRAR